MILRKAPVFLLGILISSPQELTGGDYTSWDFETDPISFHENLRRRALEGIDNRSILDRLHLEYREHSFDGLLRSGPKGNAAFILLYAAWRRWEENRYQSALLLYSRARQLFTDSGMHSEARFCLYYMARIASEKENFRESIHLLEQALDGGREKQEPYLEGLLNEALGHSLWYLDRLPESCESFGRAARLWELINYRPGLVNCRSNLGLLFQELGLPEQAWESYESAIESIQDDTFPEIKFYLYRNCALYHFRNNDETAALTYLLMSRDFRRCGEDLYQLARGEILEDASILENLSPGIPSLCFIRDLLLARHLKKGGDASAAIDLIEGVIRSSREAGMPRHTREARLALAEILTETGAARRAERIFREELEKTLTLDRIDILLPFSNAASRQLDGLVRCQVRLGKAAEARKTISQATGLRTEKCRQFLRGIRRNRESLSRDLFTRTVMPMEASGRHDAAGLEALPRNATLIEFWPDGNEIFVWIDNRETSKFVRLELGRWIHEVVPRLTSPLYEADKILPPEPSVELTKEIYQLLIKPLERHIKTDKILIIAHKELQSLPFEILSDSSGKLMIERYCLSYLPGIHFLSDTSPSGKSPLMIIPDNFAKNQGPLQEMISLKESFPELKVTGYPKNGNPIDASWIHLSSHLRLDRRYWLNAAFHAGEQSLPMTRFLSIPLNCRLLSLGACEPANAVNSASPYWMGYAEILLLNGAESLAASRWRMDELSSRIYTEFFRLCKRGLPMDEALRISKLKFLNPAENGLPRRSSHPFYWSGITYIGTPGQLLCGNRDTPLKASLLPLLFWLAIIAGVIFRDGLREVKIPGMKGHSLTLSEPTQT